MKVYGLDQGDKFKLAGDDNSPVFTYLGDYRHGYDYHTAEDDKYAKHYFDGSIPVIRVKTK